jgi:chromosome segregation ATPase
MKASFYVLAILIIAGAGYFTLEHKRKFEDLQKDRLLTIETNKEVDANAQVEVNSLKKERAILAAAEQKREELTLSIASLKATGASLERDVAQLDSAIRGQDEEFAELEKTMKEVQEILKGLGDDITIDNLPEKIQVVKDDKKQKELKMEELNLLIEKAEKLLATNRAELDRQVKHDLQRNTNIGHQQREPGLGICGHWCRIQHRVFPAKHSSHQA